MILIVYDIQEDRLRTQLSNFLKQFGRRIQYSVFEIKHSERVLRNIKMELEIRFEKKFTQGDSVLIFTIPDNSPTLRFGYPVNEETDLVIWDG